MSAEERIDQELESLLYSLRVHAGYHSICGEEEVENRVREDMTIVKEELLALIEEEGV